MFSDIIKRRIFAGIFDEMEWFILGERNFFALSELVASRVLQSKQSIGLSKRNSAGTNIEGIWRPLHYREADGAPANTQPS